MTTGFDNNTRLLRRAPAGGLFGRMGVENTMFKTKQISQGAIYEVCLNACQCPAQIWSGRPMVRSKTNPVYVLGNTQVIGGADAATSTDGDTWEFAGITPFIMDDLHIGTINTIPGGATFRTGANDRRTLFVQSFTTAPTPGDLLTQAVTGATMLVTSCTIAQQVLTPALARTHYTLYNMVTGIDLHTGTGWNTTNNVTSNNAAGVAMAPTPVVPFYISDCDELLANVDSLPAALTDYQPTDPDYEPIYLMRRGITMAWVTDNNGAIAVGDPLTWPDYEPSLVRADYHDLIDSEEANPDNYIAIALLAYTGASHTEQLIPIYLFADCPKVYFDGGVEQTGGEQGNPEQPM